MSRKKSANPRRERRVTFLTADEAGELDQMLAEQFPDLETTSDQLRAALREWLKEHGAERTRPGRSVYQGRVRERRTDDKPADMRKLRRSE